MDSKCSAVEISLVIPVYKCAQCLETLHDRIRSTLTSLGVTYEIVFIDDGSPDDCWATLTSIARHDRQVKAFRLSRNFGQHIAISAGLAQAAGRWAVVMDCDLEQPPEEIPRFYKKALEGYDIVFGKRRHRPHSIFRRAASAVYYKLLSVASRATIVGEHSNFTVISRKVINAFLQFRDRDRHYGLILNWLGFKSVAIEYDQQPRYAGKSSYTLARLVVEALNGLLFQTTTLLRWIVYLGFGISVLGSILTGVFIYRYFILNVPAGWTSLIVVQLMLGGFLLATIGVSSLYIGKLFVEVKARPLYIIDQAIVGTEDCDPSTVDPLR